MGGRGGEGLRFWHFIVGSSILLDFLNIASRLSSVRKQDLVLRTCCEDMRPPRHMGVFQVCFHHHNPRIRLIKIDNIDKHEQTICIFSVELYHYFASTFQTCI